MPTPKRRASWRYRPSCAASGSRRLRGREGLKVNAGHGLTYHNVQPIAALPEMHELNIGHAIIGQAVMSGLPAAVADMKVLMREARR